MRTKLNISFLIVFFSTLLNVISTTSFSQSFEYGENIKFKPDRNIKIFGEDERYIYVQTECNALKKARIFRFSKDLKLVDENELKTLYRSGTGAAQSDFSKDPFIFGDKILLFYEVLSKKKANFYYDVVDKSNFTVLSEENLLFQYAYEKTPNARDWVRFEPYLTKDGLICNIMIHNIGSGLRAGNNEGFVVKFDESLKKIYEVNYKVDDIGEPYISFNSWYDKELEKSEFHPETDLNSHGGILLNNGSFVFYTEFSDNDEDGVRRLFINKIDKSGTLISKEVNIDGLYTNYIEFQKNGDDVVLSGVYSSRGHWDKEERSYEGIFYTDLSGKLNKIEMSRFSGNSSFSTEILRKPTRTYSKQQMDFESLLDQKNNVIYYSIFDRTEEGKSGVALLKLNLTDGSVESIGSQINKDGYHLFQRLIKRDNSINLVWMTNSDDKNSWQIWEVDADDLSDNEWKVVDFPDSEFTYIFVGHSTNQVDPGKYGILYSLNSMSSYGFSLFKSSF